MRGVWRRRESQFARPVALRARRTHPSSVSFPKFSLEETQTRANGINGLIADKTKKCASEIVPRPGRFGLQRSSRRFLSLQNIPLETLGPSNGARLSRGGRGERGRFRRTFIHSRHNGISSRGRMRGRGARRRDANAARSRDRLHPVLYLACRSKKGVFEKLFFFSFGGWMMLVLQTHNKNSDAFYLNAHLSKALLLFETKKR